MCSAEVHMCAGRGFSDSAGECDEAHVTHSDSQPHSHTRLIWYDSGTLPEPPPPSSSLLLSCLTVRHATTNRDGVARCGAVEPR